MTKSDVVETEVAEKPEATQTMRAKLASALRAAIGEGRLAAGARLNERELCEEYVVSRTVVREALRQLEVEGFVEVQTHRGAVVTEISYVRAIHLFEVRAALESLVCELCAQRANVEQKLHLSEAIDEVERAFKAGRLDMIIVAKNLFYSALLEGAGNPELKGMLQLLHARIDLLRRYSLSADGRQEKSLSEIKAIYAAILAGDGPGARAAAAYHVSQARAVALPRVFEQQYKKSAPKSLA